MEFNPFTSFDPLNAKTLAEGDVAALAQKREIRNILNSYVGWYDPFCELIQNALDAVETRVQEEVFEYHPKIFITVNIKDNSLIVTDNGIGLDEPQFQKFLCPDISFKSGNTRGHKGVGATYLAYGFNDIQVSTRVPGFIAVGRMQNARKWLDDENPSGNPQVRPDIDSPKDPNFQMIDKGVSIYVKFDEKTHPKDLKWISSDKAEQWLKILRIKTGLGAFFKNPAISINITVIDRNGNETTATRMGTEYLYPHLEVAKNANIHEIKEKLIDLVVKKGKDKKDLPNKYKNLDAYWGEWSPNELLGDKDLSLDESDRSIIEVYQPSVYVCCVYSLKVWDRIHESFNYRSGQKAIYGGIQIAANNMPQGEIIQIPLKRNIGRQNQIHCFIHFKNCSADLGRKGFKSEIAEFAKDLARKISDGPLAKMRFSLKANTGHSNNLLREQQIENWKTEMAEYEKENPLIITNQNFFLPTNQIALTSTPTREQDVIALFNQLLAGGVIRGLKIMSTNERFTYDGLYRIIFEEPKANHLYDREANPLGISKSRLDDHGLVLPFVSAPRVLEYKVSLDGLVEDIDSGDKNSNDISLIIVWSVGELYKENYLITSYLDPNNLDLREYHGITHSITNFNSGQKEMDMIVLSDLINYLNNQDDEIIRQREKYEE